MNLSSEQLLPIKSDIPNKLILAGPGTGKSYTILGFIIDLIKMKSISPENIIVLTFTRAATAELKKKIKENIDAIKGLPKVFTLHGFALRQLMKNSRNTKTLPNNFSIADDFEERKIIMEDIKMSLKIQHIDEVKKLFRLLSSNWETLNADRTGWETNFENPAFIGAWTQHREIYGYVLRSELVYQFKNLLTLEPDARIDGPIDYLIVDEYQDLNKCDLRVISKLVEMKAKIFCAGDDDQSIYGFRFAFPEGIRNFLNDIKNSERFIIKECRRCGKSILDFSLNVIKQDYKRIQKELVSVTQEKGDCFILHFENEYSEAESIARIILSLNKEKEIAFDDIIILLRNDRHNIFSKVINEKLKGLSIPVSSNINFYDIFDSNSGQYLIAILKILKNSEHDLALRTILQLTHGIGKVTIESMYQYAIKNKLRFSELVNQIYKKEIEDFTSNKLLNATVSDIMSYKEKFCNKEISFNDTLEQLMNIIPNCDENFFKAVKQFINSQNIDSIDEFIIAIIDFLGPIEYSDDPPDGVRIMTMHKAKGLSASAVFVVGVEDEYIPGRGEIDEERRLLYVSLTRARKYLFITYCKNRIGQQRHSGFLKTDTTRRNLSRYIRDIPTINPLKGEDFVL
jgi:DNA helicase-2/ATP-dependent DNA helicase PcrA